jgi:hypothetical protein
MCAMAARPELWYKHPEIATMAERVTHDSTISAATFGPYTYGISYRVWRFS